MSSLDFQIVGLESILKRMEERREGMTDLLDKEMQSVVVDINADQKTNTVVGVTGVLRGGNEFRRIDSMQYNIYNNTEYAPYVEFGTGGLVDVPAGLEEIAIQFKGKGIRKVNLPARPFFFRAFFEKKTELIERLKKVLSK